MSNEGIPSTVQNVGVQQAADILKRKSYQLIKDVAFRADSTMRDAFGRVRVSGLLAVGFTHFEYGEDDFFVENITNGAGAVANLVNESALELTNGGGTSGHYAKVATRKFHRYVPGRSQLARWTGRFGTPTANVRQRCGYFSDRNGFFFEYDGTTLYIVRRTYTSGAVVDNRTPRSEWDDPLDGTGPSGETLDLASGTSFLAWCDMEWLGTGRYRVGFASPTTGNLLTCFSEAGTGSLEVPYMTTASLPVRYEIENTGAASTVTLKWFCYSVDSEGGDEHGHVHSHAVDTGVTEKTAPNGTWTPVLAIRAKTTGPNSVPNRGQIILQTLNMIVTGNTAVSFRIILNPTTLTQNGGAITWIDSSHLTESAAFTAAGDTVAGGEFIDSLYVPATAQSKSGVDREILRGLPLVYTELNSTQDVLVIEAAGVGAVSTVLASMSFLELF